MGVEMFISALCECIMCFTLCLLARLYCGKLFSTHVVFQNITLCEVFAVISDTYKTKSFFRILEPLSENRDYTCEFKTVCTDTDLAEEDTSGHRVFEIRTYLQIYDDYQNI